MAAETAVGERERGCFSETSAWETYRADHPRPRARNGRALLFRFFKREITRVEGNRLAPAGTLDCLRQADVDADAAFLIAVLRCNLTIALSSLE